MNQVICTVDVVLLTLQDDALKVVLLQREREPFASMPALPGGYIHADEDQGAKSAALRVLREKTGISPPYLEQLATFSGPARDPRGWSVSIIYYALVSYPVLLGNRAPASESGTPDTIGTTGKTSKPGKTLDQTGDSATANPHQAIQLVDINHLPTLPFDHASIIETAVERLRIKSQYSSLPCYLAGEQFTLPQLQRIYEALMGEPLNKVSFRRKMTEMAMLEEIHGQFAAAGAHRPAQLYRLKAEFAQELTLLQRGL